MKDTHDCAIPGCTELILRRHLMCSSHWGMLSREIQGDVY